MGVQETCDLTRQVIIESARLRANRHYGKAISHIENNIELLPRAFRAMAWHEAFYAAAARGDTELAKRFMVAIDEAKQ